MSTEVSTARQDAATWNAGESNGLTLLDMVELIRKHIVTAIVTLLVVFLAVAAYTFLSPAKYTATAQTYATYSGQETDTTIGEVNTGGSYISNQIKSFPSLAVSEKVLQPVVNKLGLNITFSELAKELSVSNPTSTFFINISDTNRSPQQAANIANAVAESLASVINELYADANGSLVKLTVVQNAQVPTTKSSPKTKLYLAAGLLLGLIAAILAACIKDLFNTKIERQEDVRTTVQAPALASVVASEDLDGKPALINAPNSQAAETFRRICTSLSLTQPDRAEGEGQLIVVTSASAGEGKTTVAVNIAATFAENGKKVLLIDADLRHPSVAKRLGIAGSVGLTHVLSRQKSPDTVIQTYWKNTLNVLPAGNRPANAGLLLNSGAMTALIKQSLSIYDYVVIDTSPMSVANDGAMFGKLADGVVLVTGKGACERRDLEDLKESLDAVGVPVLGFVFNFADPKKHNSDAYYYYYYYGGTSRSSNTSEAKSAKARHSA